MVRDDIVTFQISLGGGVVEAKCAVLRRTQVLEEVTCEFIIIARCIINKLYITIRYKWKCNI